MTVDRYIHIFAGSFILISLALGVDASPLFVSQWWLLFTAFVGANMLQAAFTGFCPAAIVFRKLGLKEGPAFVGPTGRA